MILPLRISLFIFSIAFAYFFGSTLEKFLLEVVRFFTPLETSNVLFYNGAHFIIATIPLILFGFMTSISFSGEPAFKTRIWLVVWGMMIGLISFRIYQIWWIFRGGIGEEVNSWTESLTMTQLYFFEKVLPYIIIGITASLIISIREKDINKNVFYSALSAISAFLWLLITKRLQDLNSIKEIGTAFGISCLCALIVGFVIKKIRQF